jgi:Helix-turn-helix domain
VVDLAVRIRDTSALPQSCQGSMLSGRSPRTDAGRDDIILKRLVDGRKACRALPITKGAGTFKGDESLLQHGHAAPLIRGPVVEELTVGISLNPFLSLKALAAYSGLSVRKLRDYLDNPMDPLPHYRVGGKILMRRSEFDAWISTYRRVGGLDVDPIVREILGGLA